MKGTDHFKRTIQMYLEQRAEEDTLFAKNYRNPAKNIDDCVTYILNYVQKSGCNGFTDGEIYGQAVHYYDENEIEVGKPIQCQVAVNHIVELTAEEKAEARQQAVRRYQDEELRKLQNRTKPTKAKTSRLLRRSRLNSQSQATCDLWFYNRSRSGDTPTLACHHLDKVYIRRLLLPCAHKTHSLLVDSIDMHDLYRGWILEA